VIGPTGGSISLSDGTDVSIEEGSVTSNTEFTVRKLEMSECYCQNGKRDVFEDDIDCGLGCSVECDPEIYCFNNEQDSDKGELGVKCGGACLLDDLADNCGIDVNRDCVVDEQCIWDEIDGSDEFIRTSEMIEVYNIDSNDKFEWGELKSLLEDWENGLISLSSSEISYLIEQWGRYGYELEFDFVI
jgi:hypothetical protein